MSVDGIKLSSCDVSPCWTPFPAVKLPVWTSGCQSSCDYCNLING